MRRFRRLRQTPELRSFVRENSVTVKDLIYPLFVKGLSQDEISKKIDDLEKIFLRNNIPYFAKVFLCFRVSTTLSRMSAFAFISIIYSVTMKSVVFLPTSFVKLSKS